MGRVNNEVHIGRNQHTLVLPSIDQISDGVKIIKVDIVQIADSRINIRSWTEESDMIWTLHMYLSPSRWSRLHELTNDWDGEWNCSFPGAVNALNMNYFIKLTTRGTNVNKYNKISLAVCAHRYQPDIWIPLSFNKKLSNPVWWEVLTHKYHSANIRWELWYKVTTEKTLTQPAINRHACSSTPLLKQKVY